jgi:NO-binding membrane sensor protein with MHYT domain
VSFLICALVVGHFPVLRQRRRAVRFAWLSSAVLLGVGIASMHYVGMHGLSGNFAMTHDCRHGRLVGPDCDRHGLWRPACISGAQGGVQLA